MKIEFEKEIQVYCKDCHDWYLEKEVKFINIEEDIQGADVLTFECPGCECEQKSRRYS